jgi:hypothetical protein
LAAKFSRQIISLKRLGRFYDFCKEIIVVCYWYMATKALTNKTGVHVISFQLVPQEPSKALLVKLATMGHSHVIWPPARTIVN